MTERRADGHGASAQLLEQARACESLGSPFYGRLLRHAARDAEQHGVVADVLSRYGGRPRDDAIPLRLLGSVHRLVLSGEASALAAHYPNLGGDGDADAAWPFVADVLTRHRAAVLDGLTRPPQTNEVGRAAALVGALHHLIGLRALRVRLLEIGASGGLNLRADRFRIGFASEAAADRPEPAPEPESDPELNPAAAGPADSALQLPDAWRGRRFGLARGLKVVERLGCDPHPVDPTTGDGALTLMSYVWPDQLSRWTRLHQALEIARTTPATVVRARAADFLAGLAPTPQHWTVVWHSVMWQYLDDAEQREVTGHLARAGAAATPESPLARVSLEPYGSRFVVTARTWPDLGLAAGRQTLADGQTVLGEAPPHGVPVTWA